MRIQYYLIYGPASSASMQIMYYISDQYHLVRCFFLFFKIAPKRWKLEISLSQDAVLMLSSMNLHDGIQVCFSASLPSNTQNFWDSGQLNTRISLQHTCLEDK